MGEKKLVVEKFGIRKDEGQIKENEFRRTNATWNRPTQEDIPTLRRKEGRAWKVEKRKNCQNKKLSAERKSQSEDKLGIVWVENLELRRTNATWNRPIPDRYRERTFQVDRDGRSQKVKILPQISFQNPAAGSLLESLDGFFFDLPHPFSGQVELFTNFLKCHGVLASQSEIEPDNI